MGKTLINHILVIVNFLTHLDLPSKFMDLELH